MKIAGRYRKKNQLLRSRKAVTDDMWREKYVSLVNTYPLSILEINNGCLVFCNDNARNMLNIANLAGPVPLSDLFREAESSLFMPLRKDYRLDLLAKDERILLTQIIPFTDNCGIFEINRPLMQPDSSPPADRKNLNKNAAYENTAGRLLDFKKHESKFRLLLQSVPIAFYAFEKADRSTIWYSEQIESICGYSADTLEQDPQLWESRIVEEDYIKLKGIFDRLSPNEHTSCEYRWRDRQNREIWILDQAVLLEASETLPAQVVGCFMDISEWKQAEISVAESERNYREIFNSSNDAIIILNPDSGLIEDVNETMLTIFGISYKNALAADFSILLTEESNSGHPDLTKYIKKALAQDTAQFECRITRVQKTALWVDITLKSINVNGEIKVMAVVRDIDQKRKQEEHIRYKASFEKLILDISFRFINISYREVNTNIETALKDICSFTNTSGGYVLIFREKENDFNQIFLWQNEKLAIKREEFTAVPAEISGWFLSQIRENNIVEALNVNDLPEEAYRLKQLVLRQKIQSFIDVPLFYQNKAIGFLGIAVDQPNRKWSSDEISLLKIVGQIFVNSLKRRESIQLILESEQTYREIYNATTEAIIVHNAEDGSFLDVNDAFLDMFGFEYEEIKNATFLQISSGIDNCTAENAALALSKTISKGPRVFEWQAKRKDNSVFWVEISMKSAEIRGVKRVLSVIRDINERKKTEEQLRINEEKYRLMIEGQTDLIIKFNTKGQYLFASPSYCDLMNKTEEELLGSNYLADEHIKGQGILEKVGNKLTTPPYSCYVELPTHTRKGSRWISWNIRAILNEKEEVREILAVGRDITYLKGVEEALRNSENRFRSIVQRLSDIILICDRETYIIYDTPNIDTILGYQEGFLIGQKLFSLLHPEDLPAGQETLEKILSSHTQVVNIELRIRCASGDYIPMEATGINLLNYDAIKGIVITLRNITERKLMDKRILDAVIKTEEQERERFAKNLHDDLGPLLSSIKMYISSLATSNDPEKQEFIISQLNEVVKEAITTTKDVSNDLSPHILINYGLSSAVDNFIQRIPSSIKVNFECSLPSERYSNSIENSLYRIIKELINNSLKHAHASMIKINLTENGQELNLIYSDNGTGMDPERIKSPNSKGMGISNIISRARSLNGKYQFHSEKDQGFSFNITIPIHQPLD